MNTPSDIAREISHVQHDLNRIAGWRGEIYKMWARKMRHRIAEMEQQLELARTEANG